MLKMLKHTFYLQDISIELDELSDWLICWYSCQPVNKFTAVANLHFSPIMVIWQNSKMTKQIPWSTFKLSEHNWKCVKLCINILKVSLQIVHAGQISHVCSRMLMCTIRSVPAHVYPPCIRWSPQLRASHPSGSKSLQTQSMNFSIVCSNAVLASLPNTTRNSTIRMYMFSHFVSPPAKPAFPWIRHTNNSITVIHPYYKLEYIKEQWGGEEEYHADLLEDKPNA